jgi:hypothetical protein
MDVNWERASDVNWERASDVNWERASDDRDRWVNQICCVRVNTICCIYKGPTNALVFIKTLIQVSHIKTFKITPTCFDHQMIIIRELSDPG